MRRKYVWYVRVREWIRRRNQLGATSTLMKELAQKILNPIKSCVNVSEKFERLLDLVGPKTQKKSTWFREAISARTKANRN
jgi:hypothetical protein